MLRVILRQHGVNTVTPTTDTVVGHKPLPEDSVLKRVHGRVLFHSIEELGLNDEFGYALDGYVLPVRDPDTVQTYEALWDTLVPKDVAWSTTAFDLDELAADTTPFADINVSGSVQEMLGMEGDIRKIYQFRDIANVARHADGIRRNAANTANVWFFHNDRLVNVRGSHRVRKSSAVVFGAAIAHSSQNKETSTPTEFEWAFMRFARSAVEELWYHLMGLRAAGTGSQPGEEILAALETWLEDGDGYGSSLATMVVTSRWMFDVMVPGSFNARTLAGGA